MIIQHRKDIWKILQERGLQGDAAEIGVAEGYFAADILAWPISFPRVYLVDRWRTVAHQRGDARNCQDWHDKNLKATQTRMAPFGDRAVFLRGDSTVMAQRVPDHSLIFANVDCDHSVSGVSADIQAWMPKLVPGGVMAFHDYENPAYGVKIAVTAYATATKRVIHLLPENDPSDAGAYIFA